MKALFDQFTVAESQHREDELHRLSAWTYLTTIQYDEIIRDALDAMDPPVRSNHTIFELGCGVGAALKAVQRLVGKVRPAGCDVSRRALDVAEAVFRPHANAFMLADMGASRGLAHIPSGSFDHVVSFGALAMYLDHKEMANALREASRIARPGASLCFTHFLAPGGEPLGTIVAPVQRTDLESMARRVGLSNITFHAMRYQGERYAMTCRSPWSSSRLPTESRRRGFERRDATFESKRTNSTALFRSLAHSSTW